ncbi:LysR substrate-binding domain-containing protein [Clostridium paraputrificum]|uniref:LysR substrate-binding domain-containing protein n=1 Tax=Clostridium TaxID=1485 RepID=UPI003D32D427
MNLVSLRSFYTTVKFNSISKAAKELHLTQPGLSMQLQSLENEIGAKLLNRSNKGVGLTEEGSLVYEYAHSMLSLEDNLQIDLKNLKNKKSKLLISSCKSIGEHILPCSIYTFKEIHFNIDISMEIDNSSNVLKKLMDHTTNIAIIQDMIVPDNISTIPIMSDRLILVGGKNTKKNSISLSELTSIPLILREEGSGILALLEKSLKENLLTLSNLNILLSLNSLESIKSSVASGRGYSFLPESVVSHELRTGTLQKINIEELDIPFNYYVAFRKNYLFTDYENKFLDFLTSKKRCFCY